MPPAHEWGWSRDACRQRTSWGRARLRVGPGRDRPCSGLPVKQRQKIPLVNTGANVGLWWKVQWYKVDFGKVGDTCNKSFSEEYLCKKAMRKEHSAVLVAVKGFLLCVTVVAGLETKCSLGWGSLLLSSSLLTLDLNYSIRSDFNSALIWQPSFCVYTANPV